MVLNYIWISFFVIAFLVGLIKLLFFGDIQIFGTIVNGAFDNAKTAFELSLGLTGVMTLWLGLLKVAENGGMISILAKIARPLFVKLFPDIPEKHPVHGSIIMNVASNMLGLDNAATPIGLKAMKELQELNPDKNSASNPQIMFMVLNASGLTIIPVSIMVYRSQLGAANPADVFIPILLATFCSTLAGIIAVSFVQKINLINKAVLLYIGSFTIAVSALIWYFTTIPAQKVNDISSFLAGFIIFLIITGFIVLAFFKKVNVYESFIDGAKEGFGIAVKIIPYLVAIIVAVGVFRASGAMDFFIDGIRHFFVFMGLNTDFVTALPTAIMKPLSGSGARGMMVDTMNTYGVDSFAGRLSCMFQGACDTTFYIIAVYFGAVGIKNTRHAVSCALIADLAGIIAAVFVAYLFFN